jgi:hypothetical protein
VLSSYAFRAAAVDSASVQSIHHVIIEAEFIIVLGATYNDASKTTPKARAYIAYTSMFLGAPIDRHELVERLAAALQVISR